MTQALLSLGSNQQPEAHLRAAITALRERFPGAVVSPVYRFAAVGFDGPAFLNAGAMIDSDLDIDALNAWLHALEDAHGRDRSGPRFGDRTLDIDIVYFGATVREGPGHLVVPRPDIRHAFVLKPLADIAPQFVDPVRGDTLGSRWAAHLEHGVEFETVALD